MNSRTIMHRALIKAVLVVVLAFAGTLGNAAQAVAGDITTIMADALLVEQLASGATVDIAEIVADPSYGADYQFGHAVWEKPLTDFFGNGQLGTLGLTFRYAISPDGDFYVGCIGTPSATLGALIGFSDWWPKALSLRDILIFRQLRVEYQDLQGDGHVSGGDGLSGPVTMWNKYGETIHVLYSALMMFTTYNGEWAHADRLDVWDPSGPGATSYIGSTWRTLHLFHSGNSHSLVYSQCHSDNGNNAYIAHDGVTRCSQANYGRDVDIRLDELPEAILMGGTRSWSEIDTSLHVIVVGGTVSSSSHEEYPTNGGNPQPSVLTIPPWEPQEVAVDVMPGSYPNSINCNNARRAIAVAILTTDCFDATTVDHTTLTFEGASEFHVDRKSEEPRRHVEDVDSDGDVDLVFHFRLGDTDLTCSSTEGTLNGETFDGQMITGTDTVRMVDKGGGKP